MASLLVAVLLLSSIIVVLAAPVDQETTTPAKEEVAIVEELEVIALVPVVEDEEADATTEPAHKIAKREALRGDNPSNDLLTDFEGIKYENGLSSLDGRRIKFLPTWVG